MQEKPTHEDLKRRILELERAEAARARTRDREGHIKQILLAIRNVNQLIVKEADPARLIQGVCDNLTETLGYYNAWIALLDDEGARVSITASSGFDGEFEGMERRLRQGEHPACTQRALKRDELLVIEDPPSECPDCPLSAAYGGRAGLTRRLFYGEKTYGTLSVSAPAAYARDAEAQDLFNEMADDLSFALRKNETERQVRRLEHIITTIPQPMSLVSRDHRYLAVNQAYAAFYNTPPKGILGRSPADFCGQEVFEAEIRPHLDRCLAGEEIRYEVQVDFPGKGTRWMEMSYFPHRDETGAVKGVVSHGLDVTERKEAEEALRESEQKYRLLFDSTDALVSVYDRDGVNRLMNRKVADLFGGEPEEFAGRTFEDLHPDMAETYTERVRQVIDTGMPREYEDEVAFPQGNRILLSQVHPVPDAEGNTHTAQIISRDITERRRAEEAFEIERARLRSLFEHSGEAIVLLDLDNHILNANTGFETLFGFSLEEARGRVIEDLICPERFYHEESKELDEQSLTGIKGVEIVRKRKDGREIDLRTSAGPIVVGDEIVGRFVVFDDITERRRAEEALRESEERFRTVLENLPGGVFAHDLNGRFLLVNEAACRNTGYTKEELLEITVADIDPASLTRDDRARFWERLHLGRSVTIESTHIRKDGTTYPAEIHLNAVTLDGRRIILPIAFDISKRKQAEEEMQAMEARLLQSQKMEAVGTLAGGIAHDFNNILGIIVGNTELAMLDIPEWSPAQEGLQEVRQAVLRARDLVTQILLFARQKEHVVSHIRVAPVVKESLKMLRASFPSTVDMQQQIEEDAPAVLADPSQIQQIVMNLCTNAAQVMEAKGGTLGVALEAADLDAPVPATTGLIPKGRYVRLRVSDTGPGIAPENLERIFDPFFTTKGVGEGTGLGLAVVHGIVQERNGGIHVETREGQGTAFSVFLPAAESETPEEEEKREAGLPRGNERILFVDDEPMIMKLGRRMLEQQGYRVETRASGTDALACFRQNPERFDLVITDMTMPGMRGDQLAEELMVLRPDMPVILCTGFSKQISEEKARAIGVRAFVMKPLTQGELSRTVRGVLDEEAPESPSS